MSDESLQTTEMQQWVGKMQAGDHAACDELFRRVCHRMEKLSRKMLKDFPGVRRWEDTGDVLQNALIRLMRALQNLKPDSMRAFYGLAATAIRRELIDLARHYYGPEGKGAHHHSVSPNDGASPNLDPEDESAGADDCEKWRLFHEEVEKLPAEHREVVSLIYYHGWKQIEVAQFFEVTERTIRRRWQESLLTLREAMQGTNLPK